MVSLNEKTEIRKREHIETVLREDVSAKGVTSGFERFLFEHIAIPELDLDDVGSTDAEPASAPSFEPPKPDPSPFGGY